MSAVHLHTEQWAWAHRLMLAEFRRDDDAAELVAAQIGDCGHCWRLVARYCALLACLTAADRDFTTGHLYGSLEFALDTPDDEGLLIDDDEDF